MPLPRTLASVEDARTEALRLDEAEPQRRGERRGERRDKRCAGAEDDWMYDELILVNEPAPDELRWGLGRAWWSREAVLSSRALGGTRGHRYQPQQEKARS